MARTRSLNDGVILCRRRRSNDVNDPKGGGSGGGSLDRKGGSICRVSLLNR